MNAANDLRTELRLLAERFGPRVTLRRFCDEVGVGPGTIARCWGSWTQLRLAAGLPARIPRGRLMADAQRLGRRRRTRQLRAAGSLLLYGLALWTVCSPLLVGGNPPSASLVPQPADHRTIRDEAFSLLSGDGIMERRSFLVVGLEDSAHPTKIAMSDPDRPANRLLHETSPYLQQHAYNPVDWYPWGEEALAKAAAEDRPIFLSIGYSACHWCHVMEHESFENPDIAGLMNQWFVNIKVDREERPDLDQIYMNAVMAIAGNGGWPMSVFFTPDKQPFFGGTYWPPAAKWGRPGFREILTAVHDAWTNKRAALVNQAAELTQAVAAAGHPAISLEQLSAETLRKAQRSLIRAADRTHGGFGSAPKFPHPMDLRVLLRCHRRFGDAEALDVVTLTLDKMSQGGIYDHLGGGFARYSTDEKWLVPHFEKMLYDNAQLTTVYLEAYQATGNADYARVARETLDYVLREMTQPQGGFYSTQDADSEGVEGKFFVWTRDEVLKLLGLDHGPIFCACYDVTEHGNWEHQNILQRLSPNPVPFGGEGNEDLESLLARCRTALFAARSQRVPPGRDDKVLVSWNGLMIAAMAQAANVLNEPKYAEAARSAADFILSTMRSNHGRLLHAYKDSRARFNAYLDDYAALIDGLVELYQAVFDPQYLDAAVQLGERMLDQFWDSEDAGFFYTSADHEALIARNKDIHDNATPSGNGLAATALVKLGRITGRRDLEDRGRATLDMLSGTMSRVAMAAGQSLVAFDFVLGPAHEIVVCDGDDPALGDVALRELHRGFVPNKVVLRRPPLTMDDALPSTLQPLLSGKTAVHGQTAIYVCQEGACQAPVTRDLSTAWIALRSGT
ncbi:MAG: thioredoxin domain-containing protein [Planctomycetaceae bacterium]|nr:thioredoxin domain-containing protein [Planctomycetaceae bacterium]